MCLDRSARTASEIAGMVHSVADGLIREGELPLDGATSGLGSEELWGSVFEELGSEARSGEVSRSGFWCTELGCVEGPFMLISLIDKARSEYCNPVAQANK